MAIGPTRYLKTKRMQHGEIIDVRIGGRSIAIRARTTDLSVAIDSLLEEYEPLAALLPPNFDGLIVDAGAYIGTASIRLSEMYPEATVVAIEPSSRNFSMLSRNTQRFPSIHLEKAALSDSAGTTVQLRDPHSREWGFTIVPSMTNDAGGSVDIETVVTISLVEIEKKYRKKIGLLKLDVEGQEKQLFTTADATLKSVPVIFVELHERTVPGCEQAFRSFSGNREVRDTGGEKHLSLLRD